MLDRPGLTDDERLDWLRLIRAENVGPVTFHQLIRRYGSAAAALEALPALARRGGLSRPPAIPDRKAAAREMAATMAAGARLLASCEPDYPQRLAALDDAPPLLSLKGRADILARPAVGIVGARNASAAGIRIARELAAALGAAGLLVVSGLARGIDAAAHKGALATGTAAMVGGGVDVVFPPENAVLQAEIGEAGAILAEMPVGTRPQARHFPRRNRLISGASLGIVVVEAALKSGSLITARFAAEQGREVMAVPGSPLDPRARGCNDLIRNGATLVEGAEDVLAALRSLSGALDAPCPVWLDAPAEPVEESGLGQLRALIAERLSPVPAEIDELIRQSAAPAAAVLTVLLELELAGRLTRLPGGQVMLA